MGGYVAGNILIGILAGASTTVVLVVTGVPYAVARESLVAFLDPRSRSPGRSRWFSGASRPIAADS